MAPSSATLIHINHTIWPRFPEKVSFQNIINFIYMPSGHVARMGEKRNAYSILVGKPEGKRSLGRTRSRWVDNIKIYLREIG
jgi:hypothetical protein